MVTSPILVFPSATRGSLILKHGSAALLCQELPRRRLPWYNPALSLQILPHHCPPPVYPMFAPRVKMYLVCSSGPEPCLLSSSFFAQATLQSVSVDPRCAVWSLIDSQRFSASFQTARVLGLQKGATYKTQSIKASTTLGLVLSGINGGKKQRFFSFSKNKPFHYQPTQACA